MAAVGREEAQRRALLFGSRADATLRRGGGAGGGAGGGGGGGGAADGEALELDNTRRVDALRGQVRDVRHLAIDIGNEVREHNAMLGAMHGTVEQGTSAIRRTVRDVARLARARGGAAHLCALALFAFAFFALLYLLLRR